MISFRPEPGSLQMPQIFTILNENSEISLSHAFHSEKNRPMTKLFQQDSGPED